MKLRQMLSGWIRFEITSADTAGLLNAFNAERIKIRNIVYHSDLVISAEIARIDQYTVYDILQKQGASFKVLGVRGILSALSVLKKHPILLLAFTCMFLFTIFLPTRVLFVSVEGNVTIPERYILEAANDCGIRFGASRRKIRSEIMKNALLQKVPQLQWAGINTSGCTAVISVREKTPQDILSNKCNQVCSIVARRDGIIQNYTVYEGNPICTVGQAVKSGQMLVSGYLDCGLITKAMQASAEINALTFRELDVVAPAALAFRGTQKEKHTNYSLRIGKKVIKISKDSGNFHTGCVKIYMEKCLRLPGGFQLPVSLIEETVVSYHNREFTAEDFMADQLLSGIAQNYLKSTMIAGEILSEQIQFRTERGTSYLFGKYTCLEMIGQVKYEQTLLKD